GGGVSGGVSRVFSPDGRRIAVTSPADFSDDIRVLDAATRAELATLHAVHKRSCMAFSPDGRRLVTGHQVGTIRVWDATDEAELAALRGHTGAVVSLAFSPDGRRLASGGDDGAVRVWV